MYLVKKFRNKSAIFSHLVCILMLFTFIACGGGKKSNLNMGENDDINIDEILGIDGEKPKNETAQNPEEAEVLRLLGIDDSDTSNKAEPPVAEAKTAEPTVNDLQSEVQNLESQLMEKDRTIINLRNDLEEKDAKLKELQTTRVQLSTPPPVSSSPSTYNSTYRQRYKDALAAYNARHYREAIDQFNALLNENSTNSLADNCQYWIGESYYGMGNYAQAIAEFEKVYSYAKSNKIDAAILKLGLSYLKMGNDELARSQFQQLIANYPKSEYVDRARSYLNQ